MMTLDEARLKVESELHQSYGQRSGPEELVILDEHTIERPWGWVFFYTSRGWRDGDMQYALGGTRNLNNPAFNHNSFLFLPHVSVWKD